MAPWEKYQGQRQSQQAGPWAKYAQSPEITANLAELSALTQNPQVAPQETGVVEDVAKSGASGFARGVADLVGLPGTIQDMANAGGQWLLRTGYEAATGEAPSPDGGAIERFFAGPTDEVNAKLVGGGRNILGGASLKEGMSNLTGGATDYQPMTTAGEFARTVGEFAPAAIAGPGNLLRKGAMALVPAVTSETAGQLTEGTALEPWARAGGALAGGIAAAGRANPVPQAAKGAPTAETLKSQTDKLYNLLRRADIKYDANAWARTVQGSYDELLKAGLRPSVAREAFGLVDDLAKQAGHSLDFDDINGLVQMVGEAGRAASRAGNGPLAKAYGIIRDNLDDFERTAPFVSGGKVSTNTLNKVRTAARQTALKNIKQRALDDVLKRAETYQSGTEAGIRNGLSNLLRSKRGERLFTGPERTALLQVAQGRKGLRTLSRFGFDLSRLDGNASFLPAVGAIGAGQVFGAPVGAGLAAVGTAAKAASPRLTQRAFDQTAAAIRSGGLSGQVGVDLSNQLINDRLVRRLLAGQMGLQGSGLVRPVSE